MLGTLLSIGLAVAFVLRPPHQKSKLTRPNIFLLQQKNREVGSNVNIMCNLHFTCNSSNLFSSLLNLPAKTLDFAETFPSLFLPTVAILGRFNELSRTRFFFTFIVYMARVKLRLFFFHDDMVAGRREEIGKCEF